MYASPSVHGGRPGHCGINRSFSPDIFTVTEPPPNPYADENISVEKEVFLRLLAKRLQIGRSAVASMTVERAAGQCKSPNHIPLCVHHCAICKSRHEIFTLVTFLQSTRGTASHGQNGICGSRLYVPSPTVLRHYGIHRASSASLSVMLTWIHGLSRATRY